ncbi:MAG: ComEC/Rec2 family competence protein [Anaerolineales bacterium]|nr:ComEC/Rec2 family competence protein [Anaerolineales bacterium]
MATLWITLAFVAGIVLASLLALPLWAWFLLLAGAVLVALFLRQANLFKQRPAYLALLPALLLGAWRYQLSQPVINAFQIAFYNDRSYEMLATGVISEPPDYRDTYTNLKLKVTAVDSGSGDLPVSGLLLARVPENVNYEYGQILRLRGTLQTPPENEEFSYRDYLAREGVYAYMTKTEVTLLPGRAGNPILAAVYAFKEKSLKNIYRLFNDPEASLLAGILLGVDTGLTARLQAAFKNTGTAHIIAISGFNISIIAGVLKKLAEALFKTKKSAWLAIVGVFFYALLVGGDAAVLRAALMGSLAIVAGLLGRRQNGFNLLLSVALILLLFNPMQIWDIGFQLSFFATLGLILYAEPLAAFAERIFSKLGDLNTIAQFINANVMLTLAAQLTTLPIMIYHFKRFSLVSLIANPFILPVQPAVMIFSGLALLVSHFFFPLAQVLAWLALPFSAYTIRMVEWFNRIPHGVVFLGDSSLWWALGFYATLLGVTFNWSAIQERFHALASRLKAVGLSGAMALLFICMLLAWRAVGTAGDGQLHLTFLDVGSANAILIQTPQGRHVLINGGASVSELSDELGRRLPFFSRKLDWLIVASTNENDLSALPRIVERYPPENVLWSGNSQASFSAQTLDQYFAETEIPVTRAEAGQKLELGDGAVIEIQAAGPRGSALLIQYKNFRALLPLGVDVESEAALSALDPVDVWLLADSGYAPANPPELVERLNPRLTVLSVGAGDPNGLPAPEVLEMLDGYALLRTDRNGWISIQTDGLEMSVTVERGN